MSKMYLLEPEVAGGLGPNTIITNWKELKSGEQQIHKIEYLEYVFDDWLGDDLLTSFPAFIVTQELATDMSERQLTGIELGEVQITKSKLFEDIHPNFMLPSFARLQPTGIVVLSEDRKVKKWSKHDVCLSQYGDLIVTENCMAILKKYRLEHCDIEIVELMLR